MPLRLLDCAPPMASRWARPYDAAELDSHCDANRVWATITAALNECDESVYADRETEAKDAEKIGHENGVTDTIDTLSTLKLRLTRKDDYLAVTHNLHGDLGAAIETPLDDLMGAVNDDLGTLADDLANLASARENAKAALAELRETIAATEGLASIDWRTKHDLQNGRVRADSLAKALKKDELANVSMLAIHAIYRLSLV